MISGKKFVNVIWSLFLFISRLIAGGIFIYASLDKIADPEAFSRMVFAYQILPLPFVNPFSVILPVLEAVAGICLILGIWPRSSAAVITIMGGIFSIAIVLTKLRGLEIDCGCFSVTGGSQIGWGLLLRDLLLCAVTLALVLAPRHPLVLIDDLPLPSGQK